ncbi:hypothetical protein KP509_21G012500 [Ceratopteris richardii]|uniref:NYN domain-containing protein n=1 Tax=Ceratopteris richardii TaxID=49495 RepID=A0A8T2SAC3_CERRI|nr:hypothetical protein KP509_21G012500 [Ceratopteris richardii]KAH7314644.1 hypothetical protein KP509_21G012500 [Ceratopteris richardii]
MGEDTENKSKISIWWDIENCHVPKDVDPHFVAQNITGAMHHASLTGPIEIQAFGDTKILPHATQKALTDTGITLNHVPRGTLENKLEKLSYASCLNKIYNAMKTLQRDMLAPYANNLSECIQYWDPQAIKVNVKETLETAAASCQVTKAQLGGGLIMYLLPDQCIPWDCVDPGNMSLIYRVDAWIELQRFLLYDEKKQVFLSSCSRYTSAMILKTSCGPHVQSMFVGEISNLIQQAIIDRKWLRKVGPGWGSLILNQKLVLDCSVGGRPRATDLGQHTNQGSPQPNTWISDLLRVAQKTSDKNTARAKIIF